MVSVVDLLVLFLNDFGYFLVIAWVEVMAANSLR